jgi:Fur family ferric uptake transcriptional regulator
MQKELEVFINYLKEKSLKLTDQRRLILEIFLGTDRHFTVEELYHLSKKKDPTLGQATVFRTLRLLCAAGIAGEVNFGDKKVRYEHRYGHQHHDHLVCVSCGRFIEAVDSRIEKLQEGLCKKFGFLPQRHKMEIFGICSRCQAKAK